MRWRELREYYDPPRGLPLDPEGDGTPLRRAARQPTRGRIEPKETAMPDPNLATTDLDFTRAVLSSTFLGAVVLVCTRCGACVPTSEDESADGTPSRVHLAFHASLGDVTATAEEVADA